MLDGLLDLSLWQIVLLALVLTHLNIVTVTVYLHRAASHRALTLHPVIEHLFRFWSWFGTTISVVQFVSVHRKHHATTETTDDPHSPKHYGLKELLLNGKKHYTTQARDPETIAKYGRGCPDDWIEHNLYQRFPNSGVGLLLIGLVVLIGPLGLTLWAIQMIWIPFLALGVINGVCHTYGYRSFDTPDNSGNIVPFGILIGGEELHNNHHAYPNSARLSQQWWEFDIGWLYIRVLAFLGLARINSRGPVASRTSARKTIDTSTAHAVVNARYRVLAKFYRAVVYPHLKAERDAITATGTTWLDTKQLVRHDYELLDDTARGRVSAIMGVTPELTIIHKMQLELRRLASTGHSIERVVKDLEAWCVEAEQSSIAALSEFSSHLKTYFVPKLA